MKTDKKTRRGCAVFWKDTGNETVIKRLTDGALQEMDYSVGFVKQKL